MFCKIEKYRFFWKVTTWDMVTKKKLHKSVSNVVINEIYNKAIDAGASGGKLLGAGAGGFILFYVKKSVREKFFKAFDKNKYINFGFEKKGSQIIEI